MNDLGKLAEWWTSEEYSRTPDTNASLAPQFAALCDDISKTHNMGPFIEEIDHRVAVSLEEHLRTAEPLGRHTLTREINRAIAVYRNTETFSPLNDLALFTPFITSYRGPAAFIAGLQEHEAFSRILDWTKQSPELLVEAFAVLFATVQLDGTEAVINLGQIEQLHPSDENRIYLGDASLVDLIRSRTELTNDIIGIVKATPGISAGLVASRLEHGQQALRDGVL